MTQPAWNAPENAYNNEQQRSEYGKKPSQNPSLGGWINSVMPERTEQAMGSGQYQPSGYGVPMQNMPNGSAAPVHNGMSIPQQDPNHNLDIHGIYQRLDDLAGTISRMERTPARPVYAGQNRRSEEYQPYSGIMRRNEDFQPYSPYRGAMQHGAMQAQSPEMISQLIMRVEDAERQAREAWRAAHNVMNVAQKTSGKADVQGQESAITRAERILAAADETARKTLALLAAKQGIIASAPKVEAVVSTPVAEKESAPQDHQLSAQLKAIEARLEALAEAKSAAQEQLSSSQNNANVTEHLKAIEARLESLLEEKLESHAKVPLQEKLEQLATIEPKLMALLEEKLSAQDKQLVQEKLEQIATIESRLSALLEEKFSAHSQPASPDNSAQLSSIEARLEELLKEKMALQDKAQQPSPMEQIASIEARIEALLEEKLVAHKQVMPDNSAQLASIESRIEALLENKLANYRQAFPDNAEQLAAIESRLESLLEEKLSIHALPAENTAEQLASHLQMIESRLEQLQAEKSEMAHSNSDFDVAEQLSTKLEQIESRLTTALSEKSSSDALDKMSEGANQEEKLKGVFERLDYVGQKLEQLSSELDGLKSQNAIPAEIMLDQSQIANIIDQTLAKAEGNEAQTSAVNIEYVEGVRSQISQLFNEFENSRTEDARVLDHLYQEINSIRMQDAEGGQALEKFAEQLDAIRQQDEMNLQVMGRLFNELDTLKINDSNDARVLEKLYGELSSIRQQDAIVFNEIEDISARLEDQIAALRAQISQPVSPQPPVMEALEDIYAKLEQMGEVVDKDTHDDMYAVMNEYMEKIQLENSRSEEEILEQLRMTYEQVEALAGKISAIQAQPQSDDGILQNLEHYIHELGSTFAASNQNTLNNQKEFQDNLSTIRTNISTLDQRLMFLSELVENTAQNLRAQPVQSENSEQFGILLARIEELQEKLVDAPARIGLASMEYQLHQLDNKIDQMTGQGDDSAKVQLVHDEIQSLKSAIEQVTDTSGIARLEKDISEIRQMLLSAPVSSDQPVIQTSRLFGDMITAIGRMEMGLSQVVQNSNMDALLSGFDQLNKQLLEQRSTLDKQGKTIATQVSATLGQYAESQEKLIGNVMKQLGAVQKHSEQLGTKAQVEALSKNVQDMHRQIQQEMQALSAKEELSGINSNIAQLQDRLGTISAPFAKMETGIEAISGTVGNVNNQMDQINGLIATLNANMNLLNKDISGIYQNMDSFSELPGSLDALSNSLQDRFKVLESQVNFELPARMSDIVKNQLIDGSAQAMPSESFMEVRRELNILRETIEKFAAHQMDVHQQVLSQSKLHAEAIAQAQSIAQQQSLAEAKALVMEARSAMQQQAAQFKSSMESQNAAQQISASDIEIEMPSAALKVQMPQEAITQRVQEMDSYAENYTVNAEVPAFADEMPVQQIAEIGSLQDDVQVQDENEAERSEIEKALSAMMAIKNGTEVNAEAPAVEEAVSEEQKTALSLYAEDDFALSQQSMAHAAEPEDLAALPFQKNIGNKQDFIAAARRAAQAAAAEAAEASLSVRNRHHDLQKDPFQQETVTEDMAGHKKSILERLGLGGNKAEKPAIITSMPKVDPDSYIAPAAPSSLKQGDEDELLEPGETGSAGSALKKTLLMSASAAVLAAGTFGLFTARTLDDQNKADGDFWKSTDITSSIPQEEQQPIDIPAAQSDVQPLPALESEQDVRQMFEAVTGSMPVAKPVSDQAKASGYIPYETVAGVPVPPGSAGHQVAAVSAPKVETVEQKAAILASLQFPMPIEAVGSSKLRTAAAQGNPAALLEVGNRYAEGKGVGRDVNEALVWFTRAANLGSAAAQYRLGSFYEKGYGVNKDIKLAVSWYEKGAAAGNRKSMHNLAVLYAEGYQGKPNFELSLKWFREAAERGLADSQYNLGVIYARGLGVKQDLVEAYKWFAVAAEAGDSEALKKRDEVAGKMDPKMLHWAKSAVRLFQPKELDAIANEGQSPLESWDEMPAGKVSAIGELKRAA